MRAEGVSSEAHVSGSRGAGGEVGLGLGPYGGCGRIDRMKKGLAVEGERV